MAITTWITDEEKKDFKEVDDSELNELFQEIRAIDKRFLIQTSIGGIPKKFLGIRYSWVPVTLYTLYIDNGHECQVFNFAPPSTFSFFTSVTKDVIMNFFYGYFAAQKHFETPDLLK